MSRVISSHMGPMYVETWYVILSLPYFLISGSSDRNIFQTSDKNKKQKNKKQKQTKKRHF